MKGTQSHEKRTGKDAVAELLQHASARERPPQADELAIRQALRAEWSGMTRKRKRRKALLSLAAVASVILAVLVGIKLSTTPELPVPAVQVASIEKQLGTVRVLPAASGASGSHEDSAVLMSGQQLVTGVNSGLALRWLNGESIRLAESTRLRLTSAGEINLLAGLIYVDTEKGVSAVSLHIKTPAGRVRHVGTRYMTAVSASGTAVSVREGRVLLDKQGVETLANGGDQLKVDASGRLVVQAVPTYGAMWEWTEELAPVFASDGRSMADFLDWVAHESGRALEFASQEAEQLAVDTLLRGQVDMEPMQALAVILQTSDLTSEVEAGTIVIRLRTGG